MSASASYLLYFFAISESLWLLVFFCSCFVLFEHSTELRETATEQESLQAAYSFSNNTSGCHFWPGHPPFIQEVLI